MDILSFKLIVDLLIVIFIALYWIFNFIVFYHLIRFGIGTQPKTFAAVFLLGSIILFSFSVTLFGNIDTKDLGRQFEKLGGGIFNSPLEQNEINTINFY